MNKNEQLQAQALVAQLQLDVRRLSRYFRSSMGFLSELAGNETKTTAEVLAPLKTFLTTVKDKAEAAKADDETVTVSKGYNSINDSVISSYVNYITTLENKWTNRLGTGYVFGTQNASARQALTAEMHYDLDMVLFQDAKLFHALSFYVESILLKDQWATAADWLAPLQALVTEITTLLESWTEDRNIMVISETVDYINPYTITAALGAVNGPIADGANKIVEIRGEGIIIPGETPEGTEESKEETTEESKEE